MKILAILQNQWFKDPETIQQMYNENPERRNRYIEAFLFMGCLTGRQLQKAFGEELCGRIVWEEASPKIGGKAAARFPPDPQHIKNAIKVHRPGILLTFGRVAFDGVSQICPNPVGASYGQFECALILPDLNHSCRWIIGPHPAARDNPLPRLKEMADRVGFLIHDQQVQLT